MRRAGIQSDRALEPTWISAISDLGCSTLGIKLARDLPVTHTCADTLVDASETLQRLQIRLDPSNNVGLEARRKRSRTGWGNVIFRIACMPHADFASVKATRLHLHRVPSDSDQQIPPGNSEAHTATTSTAACLV